MGKLTGIYAPITAAVHPEKTIGKLTGIYPPVPAVPERGPPRDVPLHPPRRALSFSPSVRLLSQLLLDERFS